MLFSLFYHVRIVLESARKELVKTETICIIKPHDTHMPEARITRLEMVVELLRNFLILTEEK